MINYMFLFFFKVCLSYVCSMLNEETTELCALNKIYGFTPVTGHAVVDAFGAAAPAFRASREELIKKVGAYRGVGDQLFPELLESARSELETLARLWSGTCTFVPWGDINYPSLLAQCADAPLGLYVRSERPLEEIFDDTPNVAIVGTRDVSPYGRHWCREIVKGLSACRIRPRIVSGLAIGTDICAHICAMECGLPTIAVLPTGIDDVYPFVHSRRAMEIASAPGSALISDYPLGSAPAKINFLRRNRIIAGLSGATIVVESKSKGGSLITAQLSFDYDRDVYALPGRIDDLRSKGCNSLIRLQTARPFETVEALCSMLGLGVGRRRKADLLYALEQRYCDADPTWVGLAKAAASLIKARRAISVEDVSREMCLSYSETVALLGILESDGFIVTDLLQRCSIVI